MIALSRYNFFFYSALIIVAFIIKDHSYVNDFIYYIILFNILVDFLFKLLVQNSNSSFVIVKGIMSTLLRLSLSIIFILIVQFIGVDNLLNFTLNFLIVYLLFIIFEITILLLNLQHIK